MRNNLKKELKNLLSGTEGKRDIIIIDTFKCEPGTYRYQDKIITESEKSELEKKCNKLVIFTLKK